MYKEKTSNVVTSNCMLIILERRPTGPHPLRSRPMAFLSDRSRRTENEDERPAHPLAGWGSLFNDS